MSRPVTVATKFDLIEDGVVVVAKGVTGTVVGCEEPPTSNGRFQVSFNQQDQVIVRWLTSEQITWRDGFLGPLRAILQTRSALLVDCDFVQLFSPIDLVVGGQLTYDGSVIDLKTDDGYSIRIKSDANNDFTISYLYTGTL